MKNHFFAILGITFGAAALLLALAHFWAGPFSPSAPIPTLESNIHDKISSIRKITIDAIKGKSRQISSSNTAIEKPLDLDKTADIVTAILAGIAIILGAIAYAKKESMHAIRSAVALGVGAIGVQVFSIYFTGFIIALIIITLVLAFANGGV